MAYYRRVLENPQLDAIGGSVVGALGVALREGGLRLVDLSHTIFQGMPVYPGHLKTVVWDYATHEETDRMLGGTGYSWQTRGLMFSDHGPTHVDAHNHLDPAPDAPAIDEIAIEDFLTAGVCVDVTATPSDGYITRASLVEAFNRAGLGVPKGGTVLLWTGHFEDNYGTDAWLGLYAGLDRDATTWLADEGVLNIGIDAPSIDTPRDRSYPAHQVCRDRRLLNTENLGNLGKVAGKSFVYIGLPLRIRGGTGSPIRAVALLGESDARSGSPTLPAEGAGVDA